MPRVSISQAGQASAGQVQEVVLTRTGSRAVTALRNGSGDLEVIVWNIAGDGAITRKGAATAGAATDISATDWPQGPGIVTALRAADGNMKVIAWKIAADGSVQRAGDADAGPVSEVVISSPAGFAGVVTPVRTASGDLKVIAWKVSAAGAVTRTGDASAGACSKIAVTSLSAAGGFARFATGLRNGSGNLEIITWSVSSAGVLARLHDASAGGITAVALTARSSSSADLFSVTEGPAGDLTVIGWGLASDGTLSRLASAQGGNVSGVQAATWKPDVHSYLIAAVRTDAGLLKLIAWRNGGDLDRNGELTGAAIKSVAMTTWDGGVVTAAADSAGNLTLNSWKLQPKGIRMLHRVWPAIAAAPAGPAPPPAPAPPEMIERGPRISVRSGELDKLPPPPPGPPGPPDGSSGNSSPWQHRYFPAVGGVDPMLAVGHQFVIVTQDHRILFMGRDGAPLPSKAGEATNLSATSFFSGFLAQKNPDGTPNPDNINAISPQQINEFYDTRVSYDSPSKRFAILSAARKGGTSDTRFYAVAVSKTEDPRDGFEQYMTTESNFRDFPRLTIHGDRLLVAHNHSVGGGEGEKPVLSAFDLPSLRQGVPDPPNWQYFPNDVNGALRVFLVSHNGDTGGMSFLMDPQGDNLLRIPAFPTAGQPALAPNPVFAEATLPSPAPWPGPFGVFRNKTLHITGSVQITARAPNVAPPRFSVHVVRVPMSAISTSQVTVNAGGIVDRFFGLNAGSDDPSDKVTYDTPGFAVNKQEDAIYTYGRTGVTTKNPLLPEVRYSVWLHGDEAQKRSTLLQEGSYRPTWFYDASATDSIPAETVATSVTHAYKLDYSTAVVDPVDDHSFWFIHEYADGATKSWKTVIGVVDPTAA
ncbi:MAG TPA: hypothetical protein VNY05_12995 [Candidatus Acidoferrales bacterium]|jgi:hypothetical protein|nr:hypothetical protein [Candidatus Acidoferrales bacterium]